MKDKIVKEVWNLHRKADQTRSIHGLIKSRYDWWSNKVMLFVTIGSAVSAMLIFADVPDKYQVWVGILSAVIFVVSLIPSSLKYDNKIQERGVAIKLWGNWIREASDFCNVGINDLDDDEMKKAYELLLQKYKDVMESTVGIPDNIFNKGKQKHLQKIEISKALDKTPFKSIYKIKRGLKK